MTTESRAGSLYEFGGSEITVRESQKRFIERLSNSSPVLDIGCGRGVFLSMLREAGIDAVGVDHSQEAVAACRLGGHEVIQNNCSAFLASYPRPFGGIFCSHVIEHLAYDDAAHLLVQCRKAIRDGGVLVVVTPNSEDINVMGNTFWLDPTHVRPYPHGLLCSMLQRAGFTPIKEERFNGGWRTVGRRNIPVFLLKKFILGRHFGCANLAVTAIAT